MKCPLFLAGAIVLLSLFCAGATVGQTQPSPLVAGVLEFADPITKGSADGARMLKEAGFTVRPLDTKSPADQQGVDLLVFGSYVSESPEYQKYVKQHARSITRFASNGGVVVQFTQRPEKEPSVPFLPAGLRAERTGESRPVQFVNEPSHLLTRDLPRDDRSPGRLSLPSPFMGPWPSVNALGTFEGFRVLLSTDEAYMRPTLLEAAHGKGRFVVSSMYPDKLVDAQGKARVPKAYVPVAETLFKNLHEYVGLTKAGQAPAFTASPPYRPAEPLPFVPGSYTIVAMPDTQSYTYENTAHYFEDQVRWIIENRDKYNIKYVLHLGDVTDHNTRPQWEIAAKAMHKLDGVVPYAIATGNHDHGPNGNCATRDTFLNEYFPFATCAKWPTFGGAMEDGKLENTYHVVDLGPQKLLILALEWGPRAEVVEWANRVVADHPDRRVIFITHAYMYFDDSRYDHKKYGDDQAWSPYAFYYGVAKLPGGTNDGEELWQKLVRKHPNFIMTLNGHVCGYEVGRLSSKGDHGNVVHQMLVNYQGGEGDMRLIEFLPDGKTVQAKTYSPTLKRYRTHPAEQFVLELDPPQRLAPR